MPDSAVGPESQNRSLQHWLSCIAGRIFDRCVVEVPSVGIEVVVLMEPVGCAVIIIRAAVADQGDLASGGAAEGSVRVGYTDSELIHRIDPDGNDRLFVRAAGDNVICDVDA